ncbi:MAG: sulfatase-like hydrolase/transferase [Isosphaeraceae bacterium]|nr:sulfatase-like hydrolase/transferase [Isosphaeraceae bacterium]
MKNRRLGIIVAGLLAAVCCAGETVRAADRPNILWITCEDTSPDLGCYGDTYARTPNLDRLASQGARFTRAFTVYPVCAPSRSCIITGMYPMTIGSMHMRSKAVPPPYVKCFPEYLRAAGYFCTNNAKTDYNFDCPLTAWDENGKQAHWRHRPQGAPFFSVFNLTVSHESQIRAPDDQFARQTQRLKPEERHNPDQAKVPPYYPDTPVTRKDWARYYDLLTAMDYQAGDLLRQLEEDGLDDDTIVFFYGDHGRGLPRAKRWPYDSGLHIPLIIRWPGKIQPGTIREDLVSEVDFAPTVLALAGVPVPSHMQGQVFLGEKAAPPRRYIFGGRDRMDETYDLIRTVRDERYQYIRNYQACKPYAQYIDYMEQMPTMREMRRMNKEGTLVGPQKLFFLPEKPNEELYDTEADPHEVNNLAAQPEHQERLKAMRAVLERWVKEINDLGFLSEDELKERMRPGGQWKTTAAPVISPGPDGTWTISCATEGASIAYTTEAGQRAHWKLYTGPIPPPEGATLRAIACRLGYKDSPEVRAEVSKP